MLHYPPPRGSRDPPPRGRTHHQIRSRLDSEPAHFTPYSYRRASIGSSAAACCAGQMPKNKPIAALKQNASTTAAGEISVFQCIRRDNANAPSEPPNIPITPPAIHTTTA